MVELSQEDCSHAVTNNHWYLFKTFCGVAADLGHLALVCDIPALIYCDNKDCTTECKRRMEPILPVLGQQAVICHFVHLARIFNPMVYLFTQAEKNLYYTIAANTTTDR